MGLFYGTHINRLDAKGRVSIPAPFRGALRHPDDAIRLILRPSHQEAAVEGWTIAAFDALAAPVQELPTFSAEHNDFLYALYPDVVRMETDREGRIVLPAELIAFAGLGGEVAFAGLGGRFELWEPAALTRRRDKARAAMDGRSLPRAGVAHP